MVERQKIMNSKNFAKWTLGSAIIMVTLIVLLYSMVLLGPPEWANTRVTLKAKGETLNVWSIVQPKLPEADNFFAALVEGFVHQETMERGLANFWSEKPWDQPCRRPLKDQSNTRTLFRWKMRQTIFENNLAPISGELPADTVLRRLSEADGIMAEIRSDAAARRGPE